MLLFSVLSHFFLSSVLFCYSFLHSSSVSVISLFFSFFLFVFYFLFLESLTLSFLLSHLGIKGFIFLILRSQVHLSFLVFTHNFQSSLVLDSSVIIFQFLFYLLSHLSYLLSYSCFLSHICSVMFSYFQSYFALSQSLVYASFLCP
jgi:hypothetical protein